MSKGNDSLSKTFTVVIVLCLVCSIIVSGAAVGLKSKQEANAAMAKQSNILRAAGVSLDGRSADVVFAERVQVWTFNPEQNTLTEYSTLTDMDNALAEMRRAGNFVTVPERGREAGVRDLLPEIPVFAVQDENGELQAYVMDIRGAGLWGMMYAFFSVAPDAQTIVALSYYDHSETPGLGGEIQNPRWAGNFSGKKAVTESGDVAIAVTKGAGDNQVDALSGATITSNGVDRTLQFWLSKDAYGAFLAKVRDGGAE